MFLLGTVVVRPCSSVEERWTRDPYRWWQPGSRRLGGSLFAPDGYGLRSVAVAYIGQVRSVSGADRAQALGHVKLWV